MDEHQEIKITFTRGRPHSIECRYEHRLPWWFPRIIFHWTTWWPEYTPHVLTRHLTIRACLRHTHRAWRDLDAQTPDLGI